MYITPRENVLDHFRGAGWKWYWDFRRGEGVIEYTAGRCFSNSASPCSRHPGLVTEVREEFVWNLFFQPENHPQEWDHTQESVIRLSSVDFLKRICKQMIQSSLQRRKSRPRLQGLGGLISRDGWHFRSVISRSPHISSWGGRILIPVLHLRKPGRNAVQWHSLGHTSKDAEQNPRSLPQGFPIHHFLLNYPSQNTRIPHTAPFTIFCRFPRLK